ncbi:hypothetical protein WDW89_09250 [Deltaproteobacteria bacterium TL4]
MSPSLELEQKSLLFLSVDLVKAGLVVSSAILMVALGFVPGDTAHIVPRGETQGYPWPKLEQAR